MIFNFLATILQLGIYQIFFLKLLRVDIKKRTPWILLNAVILTTIVFIVTYYVTAALNHLLIVILCVVYGKVIRKTASILKLIFLALISVISCSFLGYIVNYVAVLIFYKTGYYQDARIGFILLIATSICFLLVVLFPMKKIPIIEETNQPILLAISFGILLFGAYLIIENFVYGDRVFDETKIKENIILQIVGIVLLLLMGVLFFIGYRISKKKILAERRSLMYEEMVKYTKQLEVLHDELASFRHDYLNILTSLSASIAKGDIQEVEEVFQRTVMPTYDRIGHKSYEIMKLDKIQIPEIKSLFGVKMTESQQQEIQMSVQVMTEMKEISVDTLTAVRAISILLDNAIEEAKKSVEKEIFIVIEAAGEGSTIVNIKNSCQNEEIDLTLLGEKGHSSKEGENRGLGLYILEDMMRSNQYLGLETTYEFPYFNQQLRFLSKRK